MLNQHLLIHLNVSIMNADVTRLLACHIEFYIMRFYCITPGSCILFVVQARTTSKAFFFFFSVMLHVQCTVSCEMLILWLHFVSFFPH